MKIFKEITNSDIYEKLESIERIAARQNVHIKVQYGIMGILGTIIFIHFNSIAKSAFFSFL